jgi:HEPN domain-containing protein
VTRDEREEERHRVIPGNRLEKLQLTLGEVIEAVWPSLVKGARPLGVHVAVGLRPFSMLQGVMAQRDANREEYARWLRQAKHDLRTARTVAKTGAHDWACFLSQQAAEKALKGYLYSKGHRAVTGHSILMLLTRCMKHDGSFDAINRAKRLDEVYITSRYPNGLQEGTPLEFYTNEDSRECIALAQATIRTVEKLARR